MALERGASTGQVLPLHGGGGKGQHTGVSYIFDELLVCIFYPRRQFKTKKILSNKILACS